VFPGVTFANHQGSQPIYGHFGQPHGYVISGQFTFIVETHGDVDRVNFKIQKANDPSYFVSENYQSSITKGTNGDNYFNLLWDTRYIDEGDYKLFADMENNTATPNGWRGAVVHYDGTDHLNFSVKHSPAVTPPPVVELPENSCAERVDKANSISKRIYDKQSKNLIFIDNFMQQTTLFANKYSKQDHNKELLGISESRKAASDAIVALDKLKTFTCNQGLDEQKSTYLAKSTEVRNALDHYKDSVINLMLKVIGEVQ